VNSEGVVRMKFEELVEETKAMIRFYLFLRHEVGLKEADRLSARDLRGLLKMLDK